MFLRALFAFLLLPGLVAGLLPWLLLRTTASGGAGFWPGWVVLAAGMAVLLACVRQFYTEGKGTLAPWHPPQRLVTGGLYRYSRNPMYAGVLLIVGGWALGAGSSALALYAAFLLAAFHLRVRYYEEPVLARLFGEDWEAYRKQTRRWF